MSRFTPNRKFAAELAADPHIQAAIRPELKAEAEKMADRIRSTAPVSTGRYRERIKVVADDEGVAVGTTDPAGHIIEWGDSKQAGHGTITDALTSSGLEYALD